MLRRIGDTVDASQFLLRAELERRHDTIPFERERARPGLSLRAGISYAATVGGSIRLRGKDSDPRQAAGVGCIVEALEFSGRFVWDEVMITTRIADAEIETDGICHHVEKVCKEVKASAI